MLGKDFRYDKVVDLIEKIGYKQRVGNYYVIREKDGYINISYGEEWKTKKIIICFHKNYSEPAYGRREIDISKTFYDFESFSEYISEYHNDLFFKHKLIKIKERINET